MKSGFILFFIATLIMVGCSKRDHGSSFSTTVTTNERDFALVSDFMRNQKIVCAQANCPEGVAKVYSFQSETYHGCTGVLVSKNMVMTNAHCIYPDKETFCNEGKILFKKKQSDTPVVASCVKVFSDLTADEAKEQSQNEYDADLDFAFIQLKEEVEIAPFTFNAAAGIAEDQQYKVYSMTVVSDEVNRLDEYSCQAIHKNSVMPSFNSVYSPNVSFIECPMIKGHSGSPVINDKNEIVALIYASNNKTENDLKRNQIHMALAVNMSCVVFPELGLMGESCERPDYQAARLEDDARIAMEKKNSMKRLVQKLNADFSDVSFEVVESNNLAFVTPLCLGGANGASQLMGRLKDLGRLLKVYDYSLDFDDRLSQHPVFKERPEHFSVELQQEDGLMIWRQQHETLGIQEIRALKSCSIH